MTVDYVHAVWTKKLPLTKAMATKKIRVKGPTLSLMKLVPALDPIFDKYPDHCKKFGIQI
jgi:putative sterol carrier protein